MANRQPNMNDLMKSPQAAQLLKNRTAVENLAKAPETQHLMNRRNQSAGGGLEQRAVGRRPQQARGQAKARQKHPPAAVSPESITAEAPS